MFLPLSLGIVSLLCFIMFCACDDEIAAQPSKASKRIAFVILGGSYSHASAPLEYAISLSARGYSVDWLHMQPDLAWISDDMQALNLTHRINTIDLGAYPAHLNSTMLHSHFSRMCAGEYYELVRLKQEYFDGVWEQTYTKMISMWGKDADGSVPKPDMLACDMFASSCFDVAVMLQIPYTILVDTGLGIFGAGEAWDTPGYFTQYRISMSLYERFVNLFFTTPEIIFHFHSVEGPLNSMRDKYNVPHTLLPSDRWNNKDVIFISHWGWEWARPLPPNYHVIGPVFRSSMMAAGTSALTSFPSLERFLTLASTDNAPVVYVALGSRAMMLKWQIVNVINGLLQCNEKMRIVWAGIIPDDDDDDDELRAIKNDETVKQRMFIGKWLPQWALLQHPSVKAFITHAGVNSIQEAIHHGVPILTVAFYGDQFKNAAEVIDSGVGLSLNKKSFSASEVCTKINHLINDEQVKKDVDRLKQISRQLGSGGDRGADVIARSMLVGVSHLIPHRSAVLESASSSIQEKCAAVYCDVIIVMALALYGLTSLLSLLMLPCRKQKQKQS